MGTKRSLKILNHSPHPSWNIGSNLLIILVLEAIGDVVSPVCLGATGVVSLGIGIAASCLDMTRSWVDFEEFDNAVWLKNAAHLLARVQTCVRNGCDLQTNILEESLVALNLVEDISSTDETIKVVRNWFGVLEELVDVANRELRVLLGGMDSAKVIAHRLG